MTATFTINNFDFSFDDSDVVQPSDFIPKGEYNPHNVRPWYAHDHGFCLGVCFASSEQDALDILADAGRLDRFAIADADLADYGDEEEGVTRLGNASEPFDIESLGIFELPHVAFSFCAMFVAAQADTMARSVANKVMAQTTEPPYSVEPGRNIYRNGEPFVYIGRCEKTPGDPSVNPVEVDDLAHTVCGLLNKQAGF